MGKDQELLDAARTGNLASVNMILSGKLPRASGAGGLAGGLRSLLALRPANVNCTDTNGETPLHLAALNGHKDVVVALLQAKANVTEVDSKGCTPLHLAAWNGHMQICKILLEHATDTAIVNTQTNEGETPLHFAAQHGHLEVVTLLLQNKADPTFRTLSERSALDMAAQYGKKEVVRALLTGRPELLAHEQGQPSPLHLAAFNGHLPIVRFLLDQGFPVNTRTDNGTALHEAATSCKLDVIKLLLDRGVDVYAKSSNGMTAEDILKAINSKLTKDALTIINGHINSQRTPDSDGEKDINGIPGPSGRAGEATPPGGRPTPKPRSVFMGDHADLENFPQPESTRSDPGEPQSPPPPIPPRISLRPTESLPAGDLSHLHHHSHLVTDKGRPTSRDVSPMSGTREQPKKPPRKTPSMRRGEASQSADSTTSSTSAGTASQLSAPSQELALPDPVPCEPDTSRTDYVNVDLDKLGSAYPEKIVIGADVATKEESKSVIKDDGSSDGAERPKDSEETAKEGDVAGPEDGASKENDEEESKVAKPQSLELEGGKRRESTGAEGDQPLSPGSYPQPPTPDWPPPSPSKAIKGIQQKINPQEKRKSKDMETITETNLLLATAEESKPAQPAEPPEPSEDVPASPARSSSSTAEHRLSQGLEPVVEEKGGDNSKKGDSSPDSKSDTSGDGSTVEVLGEMVQMRRSVSAGDAPVDWEGNVFAGLLRGSTPGGPRSVVSQICENVTVKTFRSKRRSTPSTIVTFDPLMEREEDRDIVDAERVLDEIDQMGGPDGQGGGAGGDRSGGGGRDRGDGHKTHDDFDDSEEWAKIAATLETFGAGIARESVFVREYEAGFARRLAGGRQKIQSVGEWLESIGLGQYENTLVANGFDDTDFLGGDIMEDQDLETIGISNADHRATIVGAAKRLPRVQPIDPNNLPETVESWLETLRLSEYLDTFVSHKYDTMQRVVKLWELELNTVLDITSLGHRKRILASLGDRRTERDASLSPARARRRGSEEEEPRSPFEHIDLYRDYTGVKSRAPDNGEQRDPVTGQLLSFDKGENGPVATQGIRDSQIHIRPPHLMHTTGSIKQWRHRPEVLIKGCCNYTAHYLGSTVVKELKGATTTQEGIAKLKKSTEVINKIPTIMLSISYKGVKFIDAKSKKVICDHEIANIFCACQDGDHMNFFAYVTKDKETGKHYCHVFSVRSREQAGEIILTLGEAFEIAYQMALKEKAEEDAFQFERQLSQSDADDATSESSKASINTV